jgi:hypothetical protein
MLFLFSEDDLAALKVSQSPAEPVDFRSNIEDLPADVRRHRHGNRQRTGRTVEAVGVLARKAVPVSLFCPPNAAAAGAGNYPH